jgi:UDP-N-acetylmuramate dehydrogenase
MQIIKNYSLKDYNSFGFDVKASSFVSINTENDLIELFQSGILKECAFFVLGGGSNVLFTQDYEGLVVHIENKGVRLVSEDDNHIIINAAAGEVWENFVDKMVELNYGGIENLALIPGYCGSCAVQNIGAYGVEISDTIISIRYFDLTSGTFKIIEKANCNYGYRDSIFKHALKNKAIITDITFAFTKNSKTNSSYGALNKELDKLGIINPTIQDIATIVKEIRQSKLPNVKELGNAGSFFKNPYISKLHLIKLQQNYPDLISYPVDETTFKLAAGQLIELCGWKGKAVGTVGVHAKQALILVHYGNGIGQEIVDLSNQIIQDVNQKFGIILSPEVIFV